MIAKLQCQAELDKLAAVVGPLDPQWCRAGDVSAEDIRALRYEALDELAQVHGPMFRRLAKAARFLPRGKASRLALELGPLLTARLLPFLNPILVGRLARGLPAEFLADTTLQADPRVLRALVAHIAPDQLAASAAILVQRQCYLQAGQLADVLTPPAIRESLTLIQDDVALLRLAFYMEQPEKLGDIIRLIDNDRLNRIILAGAADRSAWPLLLWVMDQVGRDLKSRIANQVLSQDPTVLNELIEFADQNGLWGPVLRALGTLKTSHRRIVVHLAALRNRSTLEHLIRAAYDEALMAHTLPLVEAMNADFQAIVANTGLKMGGSILEAFLRTAIQENRADLVLTLAGRLEDSELDELATLGLFTEGFVLRPLITAAIASGQVATLMRLAKALSRRGQALFADLLAGDHGALLERMLNRTEALAGRDWRNLVSVLGRLEAPEQLANIAEVVQWQSARTYDTLRNYAENAGLALFRPRRS